jgi:hypothetical protein
MKVTLNELWAIRMMLMKEVNGIDPETGRKSEVNLKLPVSMKRHLRRLLEAVNAEVTIAEPERAEFIKKWVKEVDGVKKMPEAGDEGYDEFLKDNMEVFGSRDIVLPFTPFKLELLDTLDEIIPDGLENLMTELNDEYKRQLEAEKPLTEGDK